MKKLLLASVFATSLGLPAAHASLIGHTFQVDYRFPTISSVYESSSFTPLFAGASTTIQSGIDTVTFFANSIVITMSPGCGPGCTQTSASFNGIVITDLTSPFGPLSAGPTNFSGYTLDLSGGQIAYNQQGLEVVPGNFLTINVGTAVPEPATMALLGAGLLGLGIARRQRR